MSKLGGVVAVETGAGPGIGETVTRPFDAEAPAALSPLLPGSRIASPPNSVTRLLLKAGVLGLTRVAAAEYGAAKVRVNATCPGIIEAPVLCELEGVAPEVHRSVVVRGVSMAPAGGSGATRRDRCPRRLPGKGRLVLDCRNGHSCQR